MAKTTEKQMQSAMKYQRAHIRRIALNLNDRTDADIISHLEKQKNKSAWLKEVIRKAIKGGE